MAGTDETTLDMEGEFRAQAALNEALVERVVMLEACVGQIAGNLAAIAEVLARFDSRLPGESEDGDGRRD